MKNSNSKSWGPCISCKMLADRTRGRSRAPDRRLLRRRAPPTLQAPRHWQCRLQPLYGRQAGPRHRLQREATHSRSRPLIAIKAPTASALPGVQCDSAIVSIANDVERHAVHIHGPLFLRRLYEHQRQRASFAPAGTSATDSFSCQVSVGDELSAITSSFTPNIAEPLNFAPYRS